MDSVEVLRDDPYGEGHLVLITYRIRPGHPLFDQGERVVDLLNVDATGQVVSSGSGGGLAVVGKQMLPVGWTWLGPLGRSDYAYFGPSGYAYFLEVTERDGTTTRVDVGKVSGWYLVKPVSASGLPSLAKLTALNYQGRQSYTRRISER